MHIPHGLLFMRGALPSFRSAIPVAASKKLILTLQRWKTCFSWDETKNVLNGIPGRPKAHMRV
jgi:hypothetical protein